MRPYFKPMLVPTLWLIPLLAILIGLGTWQIQRLHWKLDLLTKIHRGLTESPTELEGAFHPIYIPENERNATALTSSQMDNADYRRVRLIGHYNYPDTVLFFTTGSEGQPVYHVITPFFAMGLWSFADCMPLPWGCKRDILKGGGAIFVDRGWIPASMVHRKFDGDANEQMRPIVGILRKPAAPNWFTPPIDGAHRIVHTRDPQTLAKAFGLKDVFPMFLEADATPNPGGWPQGGVTLVNLPNDHLQYAITWFGLALGLLSVYLAYHRSRGRLGVK